VYTEEHTQIFDIPGVPFSQAYLNIQQIFSWTCIHQRKQGNLVLGVSSFIIATPLRSCYSSSKKPVEMKIDEEIVWSCY
jgi:hypothetical protein